MPSSRFVSPPPILWDYVLTWPNWPGASPYPMIGSSMAASGNAVLARELTLSSTTGNAGSWSYLIGGGVGAAVNSVIGPAGRIAASIGGNPISWASLFPFWIPAWGPASGMNPGAYANVWAQVAVFDISFALPAAPYVYNADQTGFWFTSRTGGTINQTVTPGGANASGGFGICFNDDGTGNTTVELICYHGAAVGLRVAAPAGSIPDITKWSTARLMVTPAYNGTEARLTAWINGIEWASQDFDDATLYRPTTVNATNPGPYFLVSKIGSVDQKIYAALTGRWGRVTPQGVAVQDI